MNDHEPYEQWDAAYLLGALSPAERREFEEHLDGCERCSSTVAELAAMPALLGALPADAALALADRPTKPAAAVSAGQPSADLLPRLLARLRRRRRTRRWVVAGAGALAAATVAVGLILPSALGGTGERPTTTIALQREAAVPLRASIELTSVPWGTRLAMTCTYESSRSPAYTHRYALYVVPRSGEAVPVSTWNAVPGQTVHTAGSMALAVGDVERIELRDAISQDVLLSRTVG
ncbi:anti-sigma factor family protein [Cryobacterium tepidiphilum]|uniref:Zf-HC2 domain-containing protein n=1 Tax=Cryobacterium tepidiphilum TaxID=2486026 RepID=A0A3M8L3S4_9MICO|nr:zf-HC2 domain-containing protein [Cryobacterium tepidiphilum]RNE59378.1 zf-HC2 domain-containing protein [Cryobacterium tepidiphilum]